MHGKAIANAVYALERWCKVEIPINTIVTLIVAVVGFMLGKLWNMNREIADRVTYKQCSDNRKECPCVKAMEAIENKLNKTTNQKGDK